MLTRTTSPYKNHRFPPEIIVHAVWLYHRFSLSFREVEELLRAKREHVVQLVPKHSLQFPARRVES